MGVERYGRDIIEGSPLQQSALAALGGLLWAWEGEELLFWSLFLFSLVWAFNKRNFLFPTIFFIAFSYGTLRFADPPVLDQLPLGKRVRFKAVVVKPPLNFQGYSRVEVEIKDFLSPRQKVGLRARLYAAPDLSLKVGDVFEASGVWKRPRGFWTPFAYDIQKALKARGIYLVGYMSRRGPPKVTRQEKGFYIQRLRAHLFGFAQGLHPQARALFEALVLGEKAAFAPQWRILFRDLGLAHLLAVSGLHLALLATLVFYSLRLLLRFFPSLLLIYPAPTWGLGASVVIAGLYVCLSGPSPSALRAYVMLLVFVVAHVGRRESRSLDNLSLAVLLILFFWPQAVGALSFRLSVVAVGGLILARRLEPLFLKSSLWLKPFRLFYYSSAALLFTAPILLVTFGSLALLAPLNNVVAIPLFSCGILPLELLSALGAFFFPVGAQKLANMAPKLLLSLEYLKGIVFSPPIPVGLFLGASFSLLFPLFDSKRRWFWLVLTLFLEIGLYILYKPLCFVSLLDVGQGSAAVAKLGQEVFLFDAGPKRGRFDTGAFVVAPFLRKLGLTHISVAVISHPQADHVGGLWGLSHQVPVGEVWTSSFEKEGLYLGLLRDFSPGVRAILSPQEFHRGHFILSLWPGRRESPLSRANREALVARLCLKGLCILFPGDIDLRRERRLLATKVSLSSPIIILPHHGSASSNSRTFLKAVNPILALCSARSRYHPSKLVLRRLQELHIPFYCTDRYGTLSLLFRGGKVFFCTEIKRRAYPLPWRALWPLVPVGCREIYTSTTH